MNFSHSLVRFEADEIDTWTREAPTPSDDPQARVVLLGPAVSAEAAAEVIPSWSAETPAGAWVELQLQARVGERWSKPFRMAAWDSAAEHSRRTSFDSQSDDDGRVATDTLLLASPCEALRARVLLCAEPGADMPELASLTLCVSREQASNAQAANGALGASALAMPLLLSQYAYEAGDGWCSPTSVSMVLAYWRERSGDPRLAPFATPVCVPELAAPMIYDPAWGGTGNWSFNVAYAGALGLTAYVTRLHSFEQLARWTAAGVPVIISVAWEPGEIEGTSGRTSGHLTVVRGFNGDQVLMAEPATLAPLPIERAYRADQLYANWQRRSGGTVYLIYPPDWARPAPSPGDAWA